ncbi:MAG: glutamate racemase [Patescibacteria group bacterium]
MLATKATVRAGVYSERIKLLDPTIQVQEISAPGLVNLIEADSHDKVTIRELLDIYLRKFSPDIDALVLGCTHYPIIQNEIAKAWKKIYGKPIEIIDPAEESAKRFTSYLKRHPEYRMTQGGSEHIFFS